MNLIDFPLLHYSFFSATCGASLFSEARIIENGCKIHINYNLHGTSSTVVSLQTLMGFEIRVGFFGIPS